MTTRAQSEARRRWLLDAAEEAQPCSARNLFYRAVAEGVVPKTRNACKQLAEDLVHLRRVGRCPPEWIVDGSRTVVGATGGGSDIDPESVLLAGVRAAIDDPGVSAWAETGIRPALVVESRSLAGMLEGTAAAFDCAIWPCGGQPSLSFTRALALDRPTHIGYLGDLDASGVLIRRTIASHLGSDHGWAEGEHYELTDLAVTEQQVEEMGLEAKPGKPSSHAVATGLTTAVEAEAIPAAKLRDIAARWLTGLQPTGWQRRWADRKAEASERVREWAAAKGIDLG